MKSYLAFPRVLGCLVGRAKFAQAKIIADAWQWQVRAAEQATPRYMPWKRMDLISRLLPLWSPAAKHRVQKGQEKRHGDVKDLISRHSITSKEDSWDVFILHSKKPGTLAGKSKLCYKLEREKGGATLLNQTAGKSTQWAHET